MILCMKHKKSSLNRKRGEKWMAKDLTEVSVWLRSAMPVGSCMLLFRKLFLHLVCMSKVRFLLLVFQDNSVGRVAIVNSWVRIPLLTSVRIAKWSNAIDFGSIILKKQVTSKNDHPESMIKYNRFVLFGK